MSARLQCGAGRGHDPRESDSINLLLPNSRPHRRPLSTSSSSCERSPLLCASPPAAPAPSAAAELGPMPLRSSTIAVVVLSSTSL